MAINNSNTSPVPRRGEEDDVSCPLTGASSLLEQEVYSSETGFNFEEEVSRSPDVLQRPSLDALDWDCSSSTPAASQHSRELLSLQSALCERDKEVDELRRLLRQKEASNANWMKKCSFLESQLVQERSFLEEKDDELLGLSTQVREEQASGRELRIFSKKKEKEIKQLKASLANQEKALKCFEEKGEELTAKLLRQCEESAVLMTEVSDLKCENTRLQGEVEALSERLHVAHSNQQRLRVEMQAVETSFVCTRVQEQRLLDALEKEKERVSFYQQRSEELAARLSESKAMVSSQEHRRSFSPQSSDSDVEIDDLMRQLSSAGFCISAEDGCLEAALGAVGSSDQSFCDAATMTDFSGGDGVSSDFVDAPAEPETASGVDDSSTAVVSSQQQVLLENLLRSRDFLLGECELLKIKFFQSVYKKPSLVKHMLVMSQCIAGPSKVWSGSDGCLYRLSCFVDELLQERKAFFLDSLCFFMGSKNFPLSVPVSLKSEFSQRADARQGCAQLALAFNLESSVGYESLLGMEFKLRHVLLCVFSSSVVFKHLFSGEKIRDWKEARSVLVLMFRMLRFGSDFDQSLCWPDLVLLAQLFLIDFKQAYSGEGRKLFFQRKPILLESGELNPAVCSSAEEKGDFSLSVLAALFATYLVSKPETYYLSEAVGFFENMMERMSPAALSEIFGGTPALTVVQSFLKGPIWTRSTSHSMSR